jgi:large subunit ribosomal protein L18
MSEKNIARLRRARPTRAKIQELRVPRLSVHRTNQHIYAQVLSANGGKVLASASTVEKGLRSQVANGSNVQAAAVIGKRIAEQAQKAGVIEVAFDRGGFKYHGRVKALADAAREAGLKF